jgi:hypothetical protein
MNHRNHRIRGPQVDTDSNAALNGVRFRRLAWLMNL